MLTLKLASQDYYDAETDEYVMTIGSSVNCFQTVVKIKDDGMTWECYLNSVTFIPSNKRGRRDVYEVRYKIFD